MPIGPWVARAYAEAHKGEPVFAGLESDFGADRVWRIDSNFTASDPALYRKYVDLERSTGQVMLMPSKTNGRRTLEQVTGVLATEVPA